VSYLLSIFLSSWANKANKSWVSLTPLEILRLAKLAGEERERARAGEREKDDL